MGELAVTSNQYYGGINRRFDKRCRLLLSFGFKYERPKDLDFAIFRRPKRFGKVCTIAATEVMNVPNRVWRESTLPSALKRF